MQRSCRAMPFVVVAVLLLSACGRLWDRPDPEGDPVVLNPSEVATTWVDAEGGSLTLKPDGTFTADHACGAWSPVPAGNWDEPQSGKGAWAQDDASKQTEVQASFGADGPSTSYAALRRGNILMLWTPVGDPDNGDPHCILTSSAP
ncbi:hypothetical protein ACFQ69_16230 [Streptomyces sp. NPDC056470]|uniref:hypothetical protein n=1 Tax=Streptomyces sp. NPDC056470 TaxID=3345831 RepID=UPI003678B487